MDAETPRVPAWVRTSVPPRLWIDLAKHIPWLRPRPYLVEPGRATELRDTLQAIGFLVVDAALPVGAENVEQTFLAELARQLEFDELAGTNWAAFNDRLWDFVAEDSTAVGVMITGLDSLRSDTYTLLRCVHNLLSLTEGPGLTDGVADRQIEYFFVGRWA